MPTTKTREALAAFFAARANGDRDALRSLMAEDVRGVWPEGAPIGGYNGRDAVADVLLSGSNMDEVGIDKANLVATPLRTVVDGTTAVIELEVCAKTTTGTPYVNNYIYFYEFDEDGLLAEMRLYTDTLVSAMQLPHAFAEKISELRDVIT